LKDVYGEISKFNTKNMKKSVGLICLIIWIASSVVIGQTEQVAKWIAYPGEFGIWTHKELMSRRTERNVPVPTSLTRIDAPYGIIRFDKRIKLDKPERASLYADGKFYIRGIDRGGIMYDYDPQDFELPAGDYTIVVLVENYRTMPAIYFKSESYVSDGSWVVSSLNEDKVPAEVLPLPILLCRHQPTNLLLLPFVLPLLIKVSTMFCMISARKHLHFRCCRG